MMIPREAATGLMTRAIAGGLIESLGTKDPTDDLTKVPTDDLTQVPTDDLTTGTGTTVITGTRFYCMKHHLS